MQPIAIRDVSLNYDTPGGKVQGVTNVSLDIDASEFVCIVGPSGCGKSTLLNIIAGFLTPATGQISIAASRSPGAAWTAAWCSRTSRNCFRGAPRSATFRSGWR